MLVAQFVHVTPVGNTSTTSATDRQTARDKKEEHGQRLTKKGEIS